MSTLTKFIIYQCDTCKRQTEILIDSQRPDPLRCNITNKCRGKLSRVGESSGKKFLFTPPVSGLQDYIQRGTVIPAATAPIVDPSISLSTGDGAGMLTIAILTRTTLGGGTHAFSALDTAGNPIFIDIELDSVLLAQGTKVFLNIFPISPNLLQSKTYTYLMSGTVQVIRGPDNSPNSSNLRFTLSNQVNVFINGVLLDPSAYALDEVNQQITMTPAIFESNNVVNIIVYNDLTSSIDNSKVISLEFDVLVPTVSADLTFLSNCSWGNYDAVNIPNLGVRYLLHCTDLSALVKDTNYGVKDVTISSPTLTTPATVRNDEFLMLLARSPFGFQDKELNAYLSGASFDSSFSLIYHQDQTTGVYSLSVPQSQLSQMLTSMVPSVPIDSSLFTVSAAGAVTAVSALTHKYIIGPT